MRYMFKKREVWVRTVEPYWTIVLGFAVILNISTLVSVKIFGYYSTVNTIHGDVISSSIDCVGFAMRAYYLLYFNDSLRNCAKSVGKVITMLGPMFGMLLSSFIMHYFAISGLTQGTVDDQNTDWDKYEFGPNGDTTEALWYLFVCLTTANHPDVFMPLYHQRPWACVFTASYMIVTNIVLMNLLLAVITSEFAQIMEEQHRDKFIMRLAMFDTAFHNLVDTHEDGEDSVSFNVMLEVLARATEFDFSSTRTDLSLSEVEDYVHSVGESFRLDSDWRVMLLALLDKDGGGSIGISEFRSLDSMFHMPIRIKSVRSDEAHYEKALEEKERNGVPLMQVNGAPLVQTGPLDPRYPDAMLRRWCARYPDIYYWVEEYTISGMDIFRISISFQTITGSLLIGSIILALANVNTEGSWESPVFLFFSIAFLSEIILRAFAESSRFCWYRYFKTRLNWVDIVGNFMMWLWYASSKRSDIITDETSYMFATLFGIARGLRVIRFAKDIPPLALLIRSIRRVLPIITPYFGLFITAYYVFAVLGMALFAGDTTKLVEHGGPGNWTTCGEGRGVGLGVDKQCWNDSLYGKQDYYYNLNFDHALRSFFTLFVLMIQNNWHVAADGFVQTNDRSVRLFFILFWVLVTVIMINVFVGILIEMLDLYRRDELAKEEGGERALMEYQMGVKKILKRNAPSGKPWNVTWEIYEKLASAEQLMLDYRMSQMKTNELLNATLVEESRKDLHMATLYVPDTIVMQHIQTPYFGRTRDGYICYANMAFARVFDIERLDQVVGEHVHTLFGSFGAETVAHIATECESGASCEWVHPKHGILHGTRWRLTLQTASLDIPMYKNQHMGISVDDISLRTNSGAALFEMKSLASGGVGQQVGAGVSVGVEAVSSLFRDSFREAIPSPSPNRDCAGHS